VNSLVYLPKPNRFDFPWVWPDFCRWENNKYINYFAPLATFEIYTSNENVTEFFRSTVGIADTSCNDLLYELSKQNDVKNCREILQRLDGLRDKLSQMDLLRVR
jgi:hypothetical protein